MGLAYTPVQRRLMNTEDLRHADKSDARGPESAVRQYARRSTGTSGGQDMGPVLFLSGDHLGKKLRRRLSVQQSRPPHPTSGRNLVIGVCGTRYEPHLACPARRALAKTRVTRASRACDLGVDSISPDVYSKPLN